jgi:hypothetical protein
MADTGAELGGLGGEGTYGRVGFDIEFDLSSPPLISSARPTCTLRSAKE